MQTDPARRVIVTLDGPAGSGKSSLARRLARRFALLYLESGAFYRVVAFAAAGQQGDLTDPQWLSRFLATFQPRVTAGANGLALAVDGQDVTRKIRTPAVSEGASQVATLRPVRQWVFNTLRDFAASGGVVAEGRDMGSRVFPEAEVKIFLDASLAVRAHRRWLELQAQGECLAEEAVRQDMARRDQRDQQRREDPLTVPVGAHVLDSTGRDLDQMEEICSHLIQPFV